MKITFLGTGKGGYPTLTRNCSAIMLECGDGIYLLDAGAPVLDLMTRLEVPFEKVKGVFITHMHGDHTAGLPAFLTACSWHYTDCSFDVFLTEERGIAAFREVVFAMDKVFHEDRIRLKKAEPGVLYADENVTVTAVPTAHCQPYPSYAYVFEGEGKRVIFSGDLRRPDAPDFPVIALEEPSDALSVSFVISPPTISSRSLKNVRRNRSSSIMWADGSSKRPLRRWKSLQRPLP